MIGVSLALGVGIGSALGVALDHIGIGIALGTSIGLALGTSLEQHAKTGDQVRELPPDESARRTKTRWIVLGIGMGGLAVAGALVFIALAL